MELVTAVPSQQQPLISAEQNGRDAAGGVGKQLAPLCLRMWALGVPAAFWGLVFCGVAALPLSGSVMLFLVTPAVLLALPGPWVMEVVALDVQPGPSS